MKKKGKSYVFRMKLDTGLSVSNGQVCIWFEIFKLKCQFYYRWKTLGYFEPLCRIFINNQNYDLIGG